MNDTLTPNATEQIVKQLLTAWVSQSKNFTTLLNKHDENAYLKEVAPGRNRGIYIIGHLVAVTDNMLPLLGISEKLYPQLEAIFISNPDKVATTTPTLAELKQQWETLNTTLNNHFSTMKPEDWLDRHTKVSPEDFAKEPHRNKLSIIITRTSHMAYHLGQLALFGTKELAN